MAWAVIPWAPGVRSADLNVGVLFLLSLGAMPAHRRDHGRLGVENKYALLGGMRAAAQFVSYEIPGVPSALVVPVMLAGTMSLQQHRRGPERPDWNWFVFQPVLRVTSFRSRCRCRLRRLRLLPDRRHRRDQPHAVRPDRGRVSELTGGFHTEYSGMQFALFFLAEYAQHLRGLGASARRCSWAAITPDSAIPFDNLIWPLLPGVLVTKAVVILPGLRLHVDSRHAASLPLRSADELRLEAAAAGSLALVGLSASLAVCAGSSSPMPRSVPGSVGEQERRMALGLGIARGMMTTLCHFFSDQAGHLQYPEERLELPPWTRGRPRLIYDVDSGDLRCTACGACALACPVDVIKIEQHPARSRARCSIGSTSTWAAASSAPSASRRARSARS